MSTLFHQRTKRLPPPLLPGVLLVIFWILPAVAQANRPYYFRHYTVENGLSNNCITSILQDQTGFLWIGTKDGLNRYDGFSFKIFRKTTVGNGSIGNNYIHTLLEDKRGTLWVGTESGLFQYSAVTERFTLISATEGQYVDDIKEDHAGNLWLLCGLQLYRYNTKRQRLTFIDHRGLFDISKLCISEEGVLWASTTDGRLLKYNPDNHLFSSYDLFSHSRPGTVKWIESLYCSNDGCIIAGTSNTEIKVFDPVHLRYQDITLPIKGVRNLYIRAVRTGDSTELWLGTELGIFVYNRTSGQIRHLQKDYHDPYALSDNAIYAICQDQEGGMWVGTFFGGLNYLPQQAAPITKYYPRQQNNSIAGNIAREIKKDQFGNLWIGTEDAGLSKLNLTTGVFSNYTPQNTGLSFANIHGLLATGHELWIGTFLHGLDVMDIRTGKIIRHYTAQNGSGFTHDFIYGIYQLRDKTILITTPHGAFQFDRNTQRFEWFKGLPKWIWYTSIIEDQSGVIWAASFGKGVYSFNPKTMESGHFRHNAQDTTSLSNDRVNGIFEDKRQRLWFTTDNGLCQIDKSTGRFRRWGTANGFPSNFMFSMLEDDTGGLWVSTTKGLVCLEPSSNEVEVYTTHNGLLSDQFNYNSAYKDTDGRLYFGSTEGLISFHPSEFRYNRPVAAVTLTGLSVNDKGRNPHRHFPKNPSITHTNRVRLTHDQSTFSIDFASLSFTAPDLIQYAYQMSGLSENWIHLQNHPRVDFVGLLPGKYDFRVKAMRSDGQSSQVTALRIEVLPPWWQSPFAYAFYTLLALSFISLSYPVIHKKIKERNNRKFELLRIANEKELLQLELLKEKELLREKIHFFTNVAHEIKTPLTLIKVPLTKLIRNTTGQSEIQSHLALMNRNTTRLIELSNQLLDFRQTEIGRFKITLAPTDITKLLLEASMNFSNLAEEKQLKFDAHIPPTPFWVPIDEDAFKKIIYNLFSNAVKYAESKIAINFFPYKNDEHSFTIEVENDGPIIAPAFKEKIFEPFFRLAETEMAGGSGIGLALARSLTELHNGVLVLRQPVDEMNIFSLTLPIRI